MILVTGASGTIGSELVKRLSKEGAKVRAGYRAPAKAPAMPGVLPVEFDFDKPETLKAALKGVEKLFLVTPSSREQRSREGRVIDAASAAGVKYIVKVSVWHADTDAYTFAKLHHDLEKQIEASGIAWTHLRPNGFMQNLSNFFAASIKSQGAFYLPAGDAAISLIDVRDIAKVAALVLTQEGHENTAYELSGPEALTYHQAARKIGEAIGKPVRYVDVKPADFKAAMLEHMSAWELDAMIDLNEFYIQGGGSDITEAVSFLTGDDATPFDQFARDSAEMFK